MSAQAHALIARNPAGSQRAPRRPLDPLRFAPYPSGEMICPACSQENPASARFCNACAAPLPAPEHGLPEERKVVTVLFADLVGFTARAEKLDPEDVRAILTPYFARV